MNEREKGGEGGREGKKERERERERTRGRGGYAGEDGANLNSIDCAEVVMR